MIEGSQPYTCTKDSGLQWLGEIPRHWDVRRAKYFYRESDERSSTGEEELLSVSHITGVTPRSQKNISMFLAESTVGYKICRPGDVVVNTMWAWMAALGIARQSGLVSPSYAVYRPSGASQLVDQYVDRLLRTPAYANEYLVASTGINSSRLRLYPEQFLRLRIVCPPPHEQRLIVRFLDHTDRRIRRYIRAKQKLIKLLEEQKQAIINRAVTLGLDANVRLKTSGVEWLGAVPEGWDVVRLKTLVSQVTSGSRGWSNFAADTGALFIRIGNLTRSSLDLIFDDVIRLRLPTAALAEGRRTRVQPDDVLVSITAYIGSVAVVPADIGEAYVSQHVACCRPRPGAANPRWLAYVLLSRVGQAHGQISMYGGTKQGLSLDDVKNYVVVLPPFAEQTRLVRWIEETSSSVDRGINNTRRRIDLLRDYRNRLVADVVSGKLDVREAAKALPDEVEESGLHDEYDIGPESDKVDESLEAVAEEAEA